MSHRSRRLTTILILGSFSLLAAAPSGAQVRGSCLITLNGIEIERIDSIDSPLELDTSDVLVLAGSNDRATSRAEVRLMIGPVVLARGSSTTRGQEFEASITLDEVSPYAVGLMRVIGETDDCLAEAWLRVSGRLPLTTLGGLLGLGLALGGITGQLGAIATRRRWPRTAAALGGVVTGTGLALLGQQFGRLQISFLSLGIVAAAAGTAGWAAAWYLNPDLREARIARRRTTTGRTHPPAPRLRATSQTSRRPPSRPHHGIDRTTAPTRAASDEGTDTAHERAASGRFWCYVTSTTELLDLERHSPTTTVLVPGRWYLAHDAVGGWVHIVTAAGEEGWVPASAIHRHR